ncbi:hypothetical protein ACFWAN_05920 [Streptomyces mirabilis]|uniref:hypothetical protein n=1 Tax=Streptomyces mirabilis TaxID=68239 RepID=UPI00365D6A64
MPRDPNNPADKSGERLMAVPLTGGDPITLLRHANTSLVTAPDGSLLTVGGIDVGHWAARRITDTGADTPTLTELTAIPPMAARIAQLSLQNGTLATDEPNSTFLGAYYTRRIAADGTPGAPTWQTWKVRGAGPYATGDGQAVTFTAEPDPTVGSYVQSLDNTAGFFLPSAAEPSSTSPAATRSSTVPPLPGSTSATSASTPTSPSSPAPSPPPPSGGPACGRRVPGPVSSPPRT